MRTALFSAAILLVVNTVVSNPVVFPSVISGIDAAPTTCPRGFTQPQISNWSSCYQVFTTRKSKSDAASSCKEGYRGQLATIPNGFINSYIYTLATNNSRYPPTSLWLGINCYNGDASSCVNDDGSSASSYTNFYPGQPDQSDSCIYMSTDAKDSKQWSDFDCEAKFAYVCEVKLATANSGTKSVIASSLDYGFDLATGSAPSATCKKGYSQPSYQNWTSCYQVSFSGQDRTFAAAQCARDNGTLASVPNVFVNAYLYSLAQKIGSTDIWLGVKCTSASKSSCTNDDNTTLNYENFNYDEPTKKDVCIYMSTVGRDAQQWSTFVCNQKFEYACQVDADYIACPVNYTAYQGKCYAKIHAPGGLAWNEMNDQCRSVPGGYLAAITDDQMNDFLNTDIVSRCSNSDVVRMGLQCPAAMWAGDASNCQWDDGSRLQYNSFASGEPETGFPIGYGTVKNGTWYANTKSNDLLNCFICQAPGVRA